LAQQAAEAAEAAGAQGKFWEMHTGCWKPKAPWSMSNWWNMPANSAKVDQFTDDLDRRRFKDEVNEDFKQAVRHKIKLPPALFINGLPLNGPRTEAVIQTQINTLLACVSE